MPTVKASLIWISTKINDTLLFYFLRIFDGLSKVHFKLELTDQHLYKIFKNSYIPCSLQTITLIPLNVN